MKCDLCDKEAVVHLTQMVNNEMKEVHLCDEHAKVQGVDLQTPISITDILMGLSQQIKTPAPAELTLACPRCGMSRDEFRKNGRLGCPDCYKTFMAELTAAVKAMHHSAQHIGKIPAREGVQTRMKSKLARLQKELDEAIAREEYERAAQLRDEMKISRSAADEGGAA
ncbi:MAG: UvrB/UvrC motif-containing protein [Kiritimatiellales bacterium]